MPKSKRAKVVHLTKTGKKGKELSKKTFSSVREAAEKYQYIFVLEVENMRNRYLKQVRTELADSRIFFGKTKIMAKSLGQTPENEVLPNLSKLASHLRGDVGLLFTSRSPDAILDYFRTFSEVSFARAGVVAPAGFTVPAGVVHSRGGAVPESEDVALQHSAEPTLRRWGMPTSLQKGKIVLDADYTVCREGETLSGNQTALLKLFGVAMAEFRVRVKAYYSAAAQGVTFVEEADDKMDEDVGGQEQGDKGDNEADE